MIATQTIGEAWIKACRTVMDDGHPMLDGVDTNIREVLNLLVQIASPSASDEILAESGDQAMIEWMKRNFLDQTPIPGWGYSYGQRIFGTNGISQLDAVIDRIRKNPTSKSSTICLLDPVGDRNHTPCVCTLDFKRRNEAIQLAVFLRSQEIAHKMHADATALFEIQSVVADSLGLPVGTLTLFIASAHIYERDFEYATDILRKYGYSC